VSLLGFPLIAEEMTANPGDQDAMGDSLRGAFDLLGRSHEIPDTPQMLKRFLSVMEKHAFATGIGSHEGV
jgi:hypothetical protein